MDFAEDSICKFLKSLSEKFNSGLIFEINGDDLKLGAYRTANFVFNKNGQEIVQEHFLSSFYSCDLSDSESFSQMCSKIDSEYEDIKNEEWGVGIGDSDG